MRYTWRMDNIRRALARWLLTMARFAHAQEAAPQVVERIVDRVVTETIVVGDDDWREERITGLHAANRDLFNEARRWEAAFSRCAGELELLTRPPKRRRKKVYADLRSILRGEAD